MTRCLYTTGCHVMKEAPLPLVSVSVSVSVPVSVFLPLPLSLSLPPFVSAAGCGLPKCSTLWSEASTFAQYTITEESHTEAYTYIYIYICICTCIYVYVYIYIYIYIGWGRKLRNAQVRAKDDRAQLGSFHEELLRFNTMPRRPMPLLVHFRQTGRQPSNGEG